VIISLDHSGDLGSNLVKSGGEGHIHELSLGVHLETALDALVDGELKGELFAGIQGVGLQGSEHLSLLISGESQGGDDSDLLLLVQGFVELDVSLGDSSDKGESLIFGQDLEELHGEWVESTNALEGGIELEHFGLANTSVLGEALEGVGSLIQSLDVGDVLVDIIEALLLGGCAEKDAGISSLNGVLLNWWLVILGGLHDLNVSNGERLEEALVKNLVLLSNRSSREVNL
jgi:hypothetical protein